MTHDVLAGVKRVRGGRADHLLVVLAQVAAQLVYPPTCPHCHSCNIVSYDSISSYLVNQSYLIQLLSVEFNKTRSTTHGHNCLLFPIKYFSVLDGVKIAPLFLVEYRNETWFVHLFLYSSVRMKFRPFTRSKLKLSMQLILFTYS